MRSAAHMTAIADLQGAALRLERRCECPNRRLPLRVLLPGLVALHGALGPECSLDSETVLLTYRCGDCRAVVGITFGDLGL